MKKTLKNLSAFLKRVFKCGCKTRKGKSRKITRGKVMKGG